MKKKTEEKNQRTITARASYNEEHLTISWIVSGVGFGQFTFKLVDDEAMGEKFIQDVIKSL